MPVGDPLVEHLRGATAPILEGWGEAIGRIGGAAFGADGRAELPAAFEAFLAVLELGDGRAAEAHAARLARLPSLRGPAVSDTIRGYYALFEVLRPHVDRAMSGKLSGREQMAAAADRIRGAVALACSLLSAAAAKAAQERQESWDRLAFRGIRAPSALLVSALGVLAAGGSAALPPALQGVLRDALGQGRRLLNLLEALFAMHRIQEGLTPPRREKTDLAAVAAMAGEEPGAQLRRTGRTFTWTAPAAPVTIVGDAPLLGRAICLLLDRAAEETPEGRGVTASLAVEGREAVLRVADAGPGDALAAAPENVEHAFARLVAEVHGGRVEVARDPARGTTVEMRVPVTAEAVAAPAGAAVRGGIRIERPGAPAAAPDREEAAPEGGLRILRSIAPGTMDDTKDRVG